MITPLLCSQVEDNEEHIKTTLKAGGLMDVVCPTSASTPLHILTPQWDCCSRF